MPAPRGDKGGTLPYAQKRRLLCGKLGTTLGGLRRRRRTTDWVHWGANRRTKEPGHGVYRTEREVECEKLSEENQWDFTFRCAVAHA